MGVQLEPFHLKGQFLTLTLNVRSIVWVYLSACGEIHKGKDWILERKTDKFYFQQYWDQWNQATPLANAKELYPLIVFIIMLLQLCLWVQVSRHLGQIAVKGTHPTLLSLPAFQTVSLTEKPHKDDQSTHRGKVKSVEMQKIWAVLSQRMWVQHLTQPFSQRPQP